jgi:nucleoside-diphosphate-sugar epimerase
MERDARIFVAGHRGLVDSALCRALRARGYEQVLTADRSDVDLCNGTMVDRWLRDARPDYVRGMFKALQGSDLSGAVVAIVDDASTDEETRRLVRGIRDLAAVVRDVVHPGAEIASDELHPDGCPRKVLDVSRLANLGWQARIGLGDGIRQAYAWFSEQIAQGRPPRGVSITPN